MWNHQLLVNPSSDDLVVPPCDRRRQPGFRSTVDGNATNSQQHRRMMMALMTSSSGRRRYFDGTADGGNDKSGFSTSGTYNRREEVDTRITSSTSGGSSPVSSRRSSIHQLYPNGFSETFGYGFPLTMSTRLLHALPRTVDQPPTDLEPTSLVMRCRQEATKTDFRSASVVSEVGSTPQRVVVDNEDYDVTDRRRHQYVINYSRRSPQSPISDASTSGMMTFDT